MLPKDSLNWISGIERKLKRTDLKFAGVHVWPVARNTIMLLALAFDKTSWPRKKRDSSIIRFFKSLRGLILVRPSPVFFLTDAKYSHHINGETHLKDVDSVCVLGQDGTASVLLGLQDLPEQGKRLPHRSSVSVYAITVVSAFISRAYVLTRLDKGLNSFIDELGELIAADPRSPTEVNTVLIEKVIRKNVLFTVTASHLLSLLLRRVNPEKCYIHCYYSLLGMALCSACHRAGIPIADVQHGISGRNMRAYAGWSRVPARGYNTLPNEFMCWTRYDERAIAEWLESLESGPSVVNTGQLWLEEFRQSGLRELALAEWEGFFGSLAPGALRVVVTLQSPRLGADIQRLLEQGNGDYVFLIRAHPDIASNKLPEELSTLETRFRNVYIDAPSRMPIPVLMEKCDVNVTEWSASVYDALFAGIPSIVTSEAGRDYFEDLIEEGVVTFAPSGEKLQERLEELLSRQQSSGFSPE